MDKADLVFETTQDPKVVQRVLEATGLTNFSVETSSDAPPDPNAPAEEEVPVVDEPAAEARPVPAKPAAVPGEKRPSSGYKKKWEAQAAENERLRQEIERAKTAPRPSEPATPAVEQPKPAAVETKGKPDPDNYENGGVYDPQYIEDMGDYVYEKRRKQERDDEAAAVTNRESADRTAAESRDQEALIAWQAEQIATAKDRHPDFDAVIATNHGKPVCNTVIEAALKSRDDGAELAYWLASNPDDANRICELTVMREGETRVQFLRKIKLAQKELDAIELPDYTAEEVVEEEEAPPDEPVDAAPVAPAAPKPVTSTKPAAPPRSPAPPKTAKPAPPSPVGQRGGSSKKRLSQLSVEEYRALDTDTFRKMRKEEYGK